jgi:hypothetical protein
MLRTLRNQGKSDVSDQALIRDVWPGYAAKRLQRLMSLPLFTAKHWCETKISSYRRREWALAMLREMAEQEPRRAAARRVFREIAGIPDDAEVVPRATRMDAIADWFVAAARRHAEKASE